VQYKKGSIDDQILGKVKHTSNFVPGIKFTSGNKGTACTLLKMDIEKDLVQVVDLIAVGELENFEDKNGSGTYKASYGHDDIIMTFVQIPMLKQTPKWKDWVEEYETSKISNSIDNKWSNPFGPDMDNMYASMPYSLYPQGYNPNMEFDIFSKH
jgi:hypothetical protein